MYRGIFDLVAQHFCTGRYGQEFGQAQEDFFHQTGKVFMEDPMFENRMSAFWEWFLMDRCLHNTGVPPIRLYQLMFAENLTMRDRAMLESLENNVRGLFDFQGKDHGRIVVLELLTRQRLWVMQPKHFVGIEKGDILDGRALTLSGENVFMESLSVHPRTARQVLWKEANKRRHAGCQERAKFLLDVSYMKIKAYQFSHVSTEKIYDFENLRKGTT